MDAQTINFGLTRCNPEKSAGPLVRAKVPFQDQSETSPTGVLLSHEWI